MHSDKKMNEVTVIGAGLCGALAAVLFAKRGYKVAIFDKRREDEMFADSGRSFNITLTERGLVALRRCGLEQQVLEAGVRCFGRQVYASGRQEDDESNRFFTPYGKSENAFLLSISRKALNQILFTAMTGEPAVSVNLGHKCVEAQKIGGQVHMEFKTANSGTVKITSEFVVGADGAWSFMRKAMMRHRNWDFSRTFSQTRYKELFIPAVQDTESGVDGHMPTTTKKLRFALDSSAANGEQALQLWPRRNFLLLAMPNSDRSFSATLFAQDTVLQSLSDEATVRAFFERHFPEAAAVMPTLEQDYFGTAGPLGQGNVVGTLVETRCSPFHVDDSFVLVGDAAHAMLPFMGQGTNCAFEDVMLLIELLDSHGCDRASRAEVLAKYTELRKPHVDALATMAKEHDRTLSTMSKAKPLTETLRESLALLFPSVGSFRSAYENVAFTTIPYGRAIEDAKSVEGWLERLVFAGGVGFTALSSLAVGMWLGHTMS